MRFLHTGDWQLGMTRHFLSPEAQSRFTDDRFQAVRALLTIARETQCEFVVVCGDVFETNQVSRSTLIRALDALGASTVPVYLLPGNHDPLDAGSIYRSPMFREKKPAHVHVLDDTTPRVVRAGVEIIGAPWTSKRPLTDLCASAVAPLTVVPGTLRVLVGHGAIDAIAADKDNPALVRLASAEEAIASGKIHYVALGDRHSTSEFGRDSRVRYAGAPEATDYDEVKPGNVLVVDIGTSDKRANDTATSDVVTGDIAKMNVETSRGATSALSDAPAKRRDEDSVHSGARTTLRVEEKHVGRWNFVQLRAELSSDADLEALKTKFESFSDKERTILKLSLVGTITLAQEARLHAAILGPMREIFGAIEQWERHTELVVSTGDADFETLGLSSFAQKALAKLRIASTSPDAVTNESAKDALALLLRLARRDA